MEIICSYFSVCLSMFLLNGVLKLQNAVFVFLSCICTLYLYLYFSCISELYLSCISGDTKSAWSPSVEAAALVVCWLGPSLLQQQVSVAASAPLWVHLHTLLVLLGGVHLSLALVVPGDLLPL